MHQDRMLKNLPTPSERHMAALDAVIENIFQAHGLTDDELSYRQEIAGKIQSDLKTKLPGLNLSDLYNIYLKYNVLGPLILSILNLVFYVIVNLYIYADLFMKMC